MIQGTNPVHFTLSYSLKFIEDFSKQPILPIVEHCDREMNS